MAAAHIRIGRVKTEVQALINDAQVAQQFRKMYQQEGNTMLAQYWQGKFEMAHESAHRLVRNFEIDDIKVDVG